MSLFLMVAGATLAQNETDVLRYSQLTFGGTARSSAMAGSMGSLGADFSTLSMNPPGSVYTEEARSHLRLPCISKRQTPRTTEPRATISVQISMSAISVSCSRKTSTVLPTLRVGNSFRLASA